MNELNRPLGVKPAEHDKGEPARRSNMLGAVSLLVAVMALGVAGWLYFSRQETPVVAGNELQTAAGQTSAGEAADNDDPAESSGGEEEPPEGDPDGESEGVTGLTPLQPSGNIAVPKPRPPRAAPLS